MVGPRADLGPWADGPRSVSTGTPNSTPNSTLVMSASSESSTWEPVEEGPWPVPVGTDRTRVVRHLAPESTGEGNGDRPAPANLIHGNSLNYRPTDTLHTDAGSTPPVRNPPAGWIEEVHDKHRRGRQLLKAAFMLPRVVSRFRARQLLYRRRRMIPRSRIRMRELSRLRLRPRHLRRRQRCRHCRTLG